LSSTSAQPPAENLLSVAGDQGVEVFDRGRGEFDASHGLELVVTQVVR
jgi:hypothetical protein